MVYFIFFERSVSRASIEKKVEAGCLEGGMMEKQVKKSTTARPPGDIHQHQQKEPKTTKETDARNGMRDNFRVEGSAKE